MGEDFGVGLEGDDRTAVGALSDDLDLRRGLAFGVGLSEDLAVAVDFGDEERREGVDARYADAMETTGNLVVSLVELTSGVEDLEDVFEG